MVVNSSLVSNLEQIPYTSVNLRWLGMKFYHHRRNEKVVLVISERRSLGYRTENNTLITRVSVIERSARDDPAYLGCRLLTKSPGLEFVVVILGPDFVGSNRLERLIARLNVVLCFTFMKCFVAIVASSLTRRRIWKFGTGNPPYFLCAG